MQKELRMAKAEGMPLLYLPKIQPWPSTRQEGKGDGHQGPLTFLHRPTLLSTKRPRPHIGLNGPRVQLTHAKLPPVQQTVRARAMPSLPCTTSMPTPAPPPHLKYLTFGTSGSSVASASAGRSTPQALSIRMLPVSIKLETAVPRRMAGVDPLPRLTTTSMGASGHSRRASWKRKITGKQAQRDR